MGLLDWAKQKPKRNKRAVRTPQERAKLQEVRFLDGLKRDDPSMYRDLMLKRLGLSSGKTDELEQLENTIGRLKRMGVIKNPNEIGGESLVRDAIAGLGMLLSMQNPAAAAQLVPQPAQQPQPAPTLPASQPPEQQQEDSDVSMMAHLAIGELKKRNPQDAAAWLRSLEIPQVQRIVADLVASTDDQLPALLSQLARGHRDFVALFEWLRQRPEWLVATVHALRAQAA